jgi:hypothetical protein
MSISWTSLKAKELALRYSTAYGNYYIFASSDNAEYTCVVPTGSLDGADFDKNYRDAATNLT